MEITQSSLLMLNTISIHITSSLSYIAAVGSIELVILVTIILVILVTILSFFLVLFQT